MNTVEGIGRTFARIFLLMVILHEKKSPSRFIFTSSDKRKVTHKERAQPKEFKYATRKTLEIIQRPGMERKKHFYSLLLFLLI